MESSISVIKDLFSKYSNDEYMKDRIQQYISNRLPKIFESFYKQRMTNKYYEEQMHDVQDSFIQGFLKTNLYYYIPTTEKFFYYDRVHYKPIYEDDILHHVLTSISKNRSLLAWKKSTKVHIMAKIKCSNLLNSIPNSETIQHVLDLLYPAIFSKKTEAKYFLTIIGDGLFKKETQLIHFIDPKAKAFLRELNNVSQIYLGANVISTFKHKYYEHSYIHSRLCRVSDGIGSENIWRPIIENHFLDIMCVASHYSIRFSSSDNYIIEASNDDTLMEYVFYLRNHERPEKVVAEFLSLYVEKRDGQSISWKNMLFLWKHFLDKYELPAIIFQQNLKHMLIQLCNSKIAPSPPVHTSFMEMMNDSIQNILKNIDYDEVTDSFIGLNSKYMPAIHSFLQFWSESMVISDTEYDLELSEILTLFKRYCIKNGIVTNTMNETHILEMINYYYPEIVTEDKKYVHGISCISWNKSHDIKNTLEVLQTYDMNESPISFYEAYEFYCKYYRSHDQNGMIVSKQYFEKYLINNLEEFIIDDALISSDWKFA